MMKENRLIGGILLVTGTAIGAGMLAIPVVSAFGGFFPSFALLFLCWLFFFFTAWVLLDVNLACRGDVNLISMVGRWLGPLGKAVCWITYLLLLYSLTAAYIAGSAPLFHNAIHFATGWNFPSWTGPLPLLFLFGIFVYLGTRSVDRVNRLLVIAMSLTYVLLISLLPPHVQSSLLFHYDLQAMWIAVPVLFTSYGFHIIIPTLTTYLHHDVKKLRLSIFFGSLSAFLFYSIWDFFILSIVPFGGLVSAWHQGETGTFALSFIITTPWIGILARFFSFFAILTSFLGVSLSLSDFLADGLKIKRYKWGRELACLLTFIPPLLFVYAYPNGFILALQYAGVCVAIVLCILPALMAWKIPSYRFPLRRAFLIFVILVSLFAICLGILEQTGRLKHLIPS